MTSQAERSRWPGWAALGRRAWEALIWASGLLLAAGAFRLSLGALGSRDEETRTVLLKPSDLGTVVQVVPAVVIAIFVFAAGTSFVVAQVVPLARGTRAVEMLRGRHVAWTISPALALTPLTTVLLVLPPEWAESLALALLVGSVSYLFCSTACLLAILREATDPVSFAGLLQRKFRRRLNVLKADHDESASSKNDDSTPQVDAESRIQDAGLKPGPSSRFPHRSAQDAIDDLHSIVRTLRGWARSAATTGDSRELNEALEATLGLVKEYAEQFHNTVPPTLIPTDYWDNARGSGTSPIYPTETDPPSPDLERTPSRAGAAQSGQNPAADPAAAAYRYWFPAPLQLKDFKSNHDRNAAAAQAADDSEPLAQVWLANEIGRAMVRAVEFAITSKALLNRDRARLLTSMEKASREFLKSGDERSAAVMAAYLVELGLGARRCPPEELDWHFEPLTVLVRLHLHFQERRLGGKSPNLVTGTAAGVLKVAEAITAARLRAAREGKGEPWDGTDTEDEISALARRTVAELRAVPGLQKFELQEGRDPKITPLDLAARSSELEPKDHAVVHATKEKIAKELCDTLSAPPVEQNTSDR